MKKVVIQLQFLQVSSENVKHLDQSLCYQFHLSLFGAEDPDKPAGLLVSVTLVLFDTTFFSEIVADSDYKALY